MILELIRLETGKEGTFGILKIDKKIFCATLEPPDIMNTVFVSCIPTGQYTMMPFKHTWEVMNVPGRTGIFFHAGNVIKDTLGCILLGQYVDKLKGDRAIHNSGKTFRKFLALTVGDVEEHLTVKEIY